MIPISEQVSPTADRCTSTASISLTPPSAGSGSQSWESSIYEVLISAAPPDSSLVLPLVGGADAGKFCIVGPDLNSSRLVFHPTKATANQPSLSKIRTGDVLLEVGEYQISGYTRLDVLKLFEMMSKSRQDAAECPRILLKLVPPSALPSSDVFLSPFLAMQFTIGSPEFVLQEVTRDNIYQRVVPCELSFVLTHVIFIKGTVM